MKMVNRKKNIKPILDFKNQNFEKHKSLLRSIRFFQNMYKGLLHLLTELFKNQEQQNSKITWTEQCQKAFEKI